MDKSAFNKSFGAYIKELRQLNKLSQAELADKIGNNFQNISALERGEFAPTLFSVQKFADAFEMTLSEFVKGFEEFKLIN